MTTQRIIEAIFYSLVNYISYIPLVFFPFRKRIRYSKGISIAAMSIIAGGFICMAIGLVRSLPAWLVPIISIIGAMVVMTWGLDVHPGKSAMVLLMEYSNASFITVIAKNVEMYFFPHRLHIFYGWTHSIFILVGVIALYLFDYFVMWKVLDPVINMPHDNHTWAYIWITTLSFYLVWFIYVYTSESYRSGTLEDPFVLIMLIFFECGSIVTYFILIQLVYYENETSRLEYQEMLNQSQYKHLSQRIDEARKSRHDIRHHLLMIDALAKEGDLQGIRNYLSQFSEKEASDNVLVYCEHFGTNALLSYYAQQAKAEGMTFTAKCNIPSAIGISDKDLTIILSNLLENAMNACRKIEGGEKSISMTGRYEDAGLTLMIKNTSMAAPKVDQNGRYISTSHGGYGVGIESVQTIVQKYNGIMKMNFDGEAVLVSIMLMV